MFASPALGASTAPRPPRGSGVLEADVQSDYSHIRVRKHGDIRTMLFVRDRGEEVIESMVNLKRPYEMLAPYSRYMFASYLFQPKHERVLIVGLGGGAMVHFYEHYDSGVQVEAVEIDPAVVKLAEQFFKVRSGGNVRILTEDGLKYLEKTDAQYDVIYMDAFLKPAADTDATGMPLRMKTIQFYKGVRQKLSAGGVVAFNLNVHRGIQDDIQTIRGAFGETYVFRLPEGNVVVIATTASEREKPVVLRDRARELDTRFKATFSFVELLSRLSR
jgi:spermidine synthase